MKFKIAYVIFLIVCLLYNKLPFLGPFSVRHILTIVMLILCALENGLKFDRFLKWFCVYLLFSAIGSMASGYTSDFFGRLFGTHLAAITMYLSTKVLLRNHDGSRWLLTTVLTVAVLNALTSIWQFYGSPFASLILQLLRIDLSEEMIEFYEETEDFHGTYVGGFIGIVSSGYFLAASCIIALYNKKRAIKVPNWFLFFSIFFALFLVQERAGLGAAIISIFLYLMVNLVNSKKSFFRLVAIFIGGVVFIHFFGGILVNFGEMRYSTIGLDDHGRNSLFMKGWNYFLDHPMGGYDAYHASGFRDPHSILVNAFLNGGLFGGLVIILLIFRQIVLITRIVIKSFLIKRYSLLLNSLALALLCYIVNSFFHNASLASGEVMTFVLWGAVNVLFEMEESSKMPSINNS